MKQPPSDGKCELCGATFNKTTMTTHLQRKCLRGHDAAKGKPQKLIHLVADGDGPYWLHLEMPGKAKFAHLDRFLRRIWLECCGHMSAFEFHRDIMRRLDLDLDSPIDLEFPEDALMDYAVQEILEPKLAFNYEYDFGSTTRLWLRVAGIRDGIWSGKDKVRLLARNLPPALGCAECGKPAKWHDSASRAAICASCAEKDVERYLLPVVNSPRMGVCAYTGQD